MEGTTQVHGLQSQQTLASSLSFSPDSSLHTLFTADSNTACCPHCMPAHNCIVSLLSWIISAGGSSAEPNWNGTQTFTIMQV